MLGVVNALGADAVGEELNHSRYLDILMSPLTAKRQLVSNSDKDSFHQPKHGMWCRRQRWWRANNSGGSGGDSESENFVADSFDARPWIISDAQLPRITRGSSLLPLDWWSSLQGLRVRRVMFYIAIMLMRRTMRFSSDEAIGCLTSSGYMLFLRITRGREISISDSDDLYSICLDRGEPWCILKLPGFHEESSEYIQVEGMRIFVRITDFNGTCDL